MNEIQNEIPQMVSIAVTPKYYHTTINFDIEMVGEGYSCSSVTIVSESPLCENDYGKIVSAIVRSKYSADEVEAIQLNYMERKTTEHKNEFAQLKGWRTFAKAKAKEVLEYVASLRGE